MGEVAVLIDDAAGGFIPGDGNGHDLAATLGVIPGILTAFGTSLAALSGWMTDSTICRPGAHAPGLVAAISQSARTAAEVAQSAADRYRKENEFWLRDGPAGNVNQAAVSLAEDVTAGFIPENDAVNPPGYLLADNLAVFPELFELIAEQLSILADWMTGVSGTAGESSSSLVAEAANSVNAMTEAAEAAASEFRAENWFWLTDRGN